MLADRFMNTNNMRTYDKLIATILASQAKGDLRPFPGMALADDVDHAIGASAHPQEVG
jgi:hypothetical protein